MQYRKIGPEHPSYSRLQACRKAGQWMCDAVSHNAKDGCTNPDCFKYVDRRLSKKAPKRADPRTVLGTFYGGPALFYDSESDAFVVREWGESTGSSVVLGQGKSMAAAIDAANEMLLRRPYSGKR